jgi:hypothetical protein
MERERYGRGRGGGINRYPDVSGRTAARSPRGQDDRPREATRPTGSAEPWSEVPPELEAMLREQVGQRPTAPLMDATETPPGTRPDVVDETVPTSAEADVAETPAAASPKRRARTSTTTTRTRTTKAKAKASDDGEKAPPKRRTTGKATAAASEDDASSATAPKRRTTKKAAAKAEASPATTDEGDAATDADPTAAGPTDADAAPKRRTTRRTTAKTTS